MNFFSMAVNNIKKKSDTYFTYFLSTTFAVTIFYIFCSIYYNPEFESFHTGVSKINILFKLSAIVVLAFSSVFVYYANTLFIKSRKKEIAIFSLLGMKKKEIGTLLFLETFLVGIASILGGILLGSLFSRFFSMILTKLMLGGAPGNSLSFQLTWQPAVISFFVFLLLFTANAIWSLRTIYQSKLIELLSAEKEGECAPEFSWVSSLAAVVLIAISYAIFLNFSGDDGAMKLIGPALFASALLAGGTYLLFQNVVIYVLVKCKNNIQFYFRTGNFISTSQLVYRIKANSNLFCVIALLSAFTISLMSTVTSFYVSLGKTMPVYAPYSYLCENIDETMKENVSNMISQDDNVAFYASTDFDVIKTTGKAKGYKVDTNSAYGKVVTGTGEDFTMDIIKLSDYQNILKDTKAKKVSGKKHGNMQAVFVDELKNGECLFLDGNYSHDYSDDLKGKTVYATTDVGESPFKIVDVSLYKYMGSAHGRTTLVVNDSDYANYYKDPTVYGLKNYTGYKFLNPLEVSDLYDALNTVVPNDHRDRTYLEYHQTLFNNYGAYIFIGIFLGVLFLLAAGSVIFYKQMMEARDDTRRYEILKKIGMSKKEATDSIRRQIATVFLLPFSVAVIHAIVILITYKHMVYTIAEDTPVLEYAFMVTGAFFFIYFFFYIISVKGYKKTVWRA